MAWIFSFQPLRVAAVAQICGLERQPHVGLDGLGLFRAESCASRHAWQDPVPVLARVSNDRLRAVTSSAGRDVKHPTLRQTAGVDLVGGRYLKDRRVYGRGKILDRRATNDHKTYHQHNCQDRPPNWKMVHTPLHAQSLHLPASSQVFASEIEPKDEPKLEVRLGVNVRNLSKGRDRRPPLPGAVGEVRAEVEHVVTPVRPIFVLDLV